jgi:hypothetical protein
MSNELMNYIAGQADRRVSLLMPVNNQWVRQENCCIKFITFTSNGDINQIHIQDSEGWTKGHDPALMVKKNFCIFRNYMMKGNFPVTIMRSQWYRNEKFFHFYGELKAYCEAEGLIDDNGVPVAPSPYQTHGFNLVAMGTVDEEALQITDRTRKAYYAWKSGYYEASSDEEEFFANRTETDDSDDESEDEDRLLW